MIYPSFSNLIIALETHGTEDDTSEGTPETYGETDEGVLNGETNEGVLNGEHEPETGEDVKDENADNTPTNAPQRTRKERVKDQLVLSTPYDFWLKLLAKREDAKYFIILPFLLFL